MANSIEAEGKRAAISFDGIHVTITRQAANGRAQGQVRISVARISTVRWRPASAVVSGFIQFVVAGTANDGYAVSYSHGQQAAVQALMRAVEENVGARGARGARGSLSA